MCRGSERCFYFALPRDDSHINVALLDFNMICQTAGGCPEKGRIYAKGHYAKRASVIYYKRENAE